MKKYNKEFKGFGAQKEPELTEKEINYLTINDVLGCLSQYVPYLLEESGNQSQIEFRSMVPANNSPGMGDGDLFVGSLFFKGEEDICVMVTHSREEGLEVNVSPISPMGVNEETPLTESLQGILSDFINTKKWAVSTFWTDKKGKKGSMCTYTHKEEYVGGKAEDMIPDGAERSGPSPCSEHGSLWEVLKFCIKMNSVGHGPGLRYIRSMIEEWSGKIEAEIERIFKVDREITSFLEKKGYEIVGSGMTPFQPIPMSRNVEIKIGDEEWGVSYNSLGKVVEHYKGSYAYGIPEFEIGVPENLKEDLKQWSL